jgi:hypothetical protein
MMEKGGWDLLFAAAPMGVDGDPAKSMHRPRRSDGTSVRVQHETHHANDALPLRVTLCDHGDYCFELFAPIASEDPLRMKAHCGR